MNDSPPLPHVDLVGLGGIGAPLIPVLLRSASSLTLWDPDTYEKTNVLRQAYPDWVGQNKSTVHYNKHLPLSQALPHKPVFSTYHNKWMPKPVWVKEDAPWVVICTADNSEARLTVLESAKSPEGPNLVIFAANELYGGEAYVYSRELPGFPDPAEYFPHAFADGVAAENAPHCHTLANEAGGGQTASTNHKVGGDAIFLFEAWTQHISTDLIRANVEVPYLITSDKIRKEVKTWQLPTSTED